MIQQSPGALSEAAGVYKDQVNQTVKIRVSDKGGSSDSGHGFGQYIKNIADPTGSSQIKAISGNLYDLTHNSDEGKVSFEALSQTTGATREQFAAWNKHLGETGEHFDRDSKAVENFQAWLRENAANTAADTEETQKNEKAKQAQTDAIGQLVDAQQAQVAAGTAVRDAQTGVRDADQGVVDAQKAHEPLATVHPLLNERRAEGSRAGDSWRV